MLKLKSRLIRIIQTNLVIPCNGSAYPYVSADLSTDLNGVIPSKTELYPSSIEDGKTDLLLMLAYRSYSRYLKNCRQSNQETSVFCTVFLVRKKTFLTILIEPESELVLG